MASYNRVILLGNLTRDPELRTTPNGTSICRFSIAASRQFRNADGSAREEVVFVEIDSFGKQAETIARYMAKGRPILVEGRLRLDQWESQNGEKRSRLMVVAENFQFLGSPKQDGSGFSDGIPEMTNFEEKSRPAAAKGAPAMDGEEIDGEIPF